MPSDQSASDTDRYECTLCGSDIFHAIVTENDLSFLRCVTCDRVVIPEHQSIGLEGGDQEADRDD